MSTTIASIKEQVVNEYPAKVYKKMVVKSMSGEDQPILNPRDLQQVSNIKKRVDKANRLSHDDLYNLVELSYHLSDFVRNVTIFPDLLCMAASSNLLQELDRLLHLKSTEPVTLFYDTTFNISDFYVSPLTVKHMLFKKNPSIPVAFLIHERKYQRHHELFFETLSELVPIRLKNIAGSQMKYLFMLSI